MEIDERLIEQLIEGFTSSAMFSAEKSFNEAYDGFIEEYLKLKFYTHCIPEEELERIDHLYSKVNNMIMLFIGTRNDQEHHFYYELKKLQDKIIALRSKVEEIINNKSLISQKK